MAQIQRGWKVRFSNEWQRSFTSVRDFSTDTQKTSNKPIDGEQNKPKNVETIEFKAETKEILKIMTHSLYTDKEVFVRELVSNASDALEKLRHAQVASATSVVEGDLPLEIKIEIDESTGNITIADTGIGMTKQEMIDNLGTIARSGSRDFVAELKRVTEGGEVDMTKGIIGKFGVGFYAVFMVAKRVEVVSRSALKEHENEPAQVWSSDGSSFEIGELEDSVRQSRGTSVKLYLEDSYLEFLDQKRIQKILSRYSNFVGFPIYLMGEKLNSVEAIWTRDPKDVKEEEYAGFYKYVANAYDDPLDTYHFRVDAPLDIKALFFIPSFHTEKYGQGRMEPSVSLYCRKVLIEAKSPNILPDWLRFVKGVVDSEDLPLAISREKVQDSKLIGKLRSVLTRKYIAHLAKLAKDDRNTYINEFYKEYSFFLKEGICQDFEFQGQLSKLLYFETSKNTEDDLLSFDEYIANMRPEQKDIFYLVAPSRDVALNSPYLETFEKAGVEVIFLFNPIDDFVMGNLKEYEGRPLVSVEKGDINLSDFSKSEDEDKDGNIFKSEEELSVADRLELCNWFKKTFENQIASCTISNRLSSSPAIVTDHESGALRRMMRMVDTTEAARDQFKLPKQHMELNPSHKIIHGINALRESQPALAKVLAEQVFDNCLVAAGLLDDSRSMLPRLNDLLLCVVNGATTDPSGFIKESKTENKDENTSQDGNDGLAQKEGEGSTTSTSDFRKDSAQ